MTEPIKAVASCGQVTPVPAVAVQLQDVVAGAVAVAGVVNVKQQSYALGHAVMLPPVICKQTQTCPSSWQVQPPPELPPAPVVPPAPVEPPVPVVIWQAGSWQAAN